MSDDSKDFPDLDSIFRMVTPYDFVGASAVGASNVNDQDNVVRQLMRILYGAGYGNSALSTLDMITQIQQLATNATKQQKQDLARVISIMGVDKTLNIEGFNEWAYTGVNIDDNGVNPHQITSVYDLFVGRAKELVSKEDLRKTPFGVVCINSPFLGPQVRDAEKAEIFLNGIPTLVMSRCVPVVEMAFLFKRPNANQLQTFSLMKFLLGADQTTFDGADRAMIEATTQYDKDKNAYYTAEMEVFTAPQTLLNMNTITPGARYVDVLDPMRPLASLHNLTINVTPTAGLYSYKKATAQIKLHDRSRLSEISDLVRPQVYTQTTVSITYGWRHPDEPGNPYADFINANMVKREAYGVQNASFVFDADGGISITLELFMKGPHELHQLVVADQPNSVGKVLKDIEEMTEQIKDYRRRLNLDAPEGAGGEEIRNVTILNAAERGVLPDFKPKEIAEAVSKLQVALQKNAIDEVAANGLINGLHTLYGQDGTKGLVDSLKNAQHTAANSKFAVMKDSIDPWIPYADKISEKMTKIGMDGVVPPIMWSMISAKTADKKVPSVKTTDLLKTAKMFGKTSDVVSFGNVFVAGIASTMLCAHGIDEVQVFFYILNDRAGNARCMNIAEFPVDIQDLTNIYAEELEHLGSDSMSIIEFMTLVIRASIDDMRAIGYGFRQFFSPDPDKEHKGKYVVKQENQADYESAQAVICGTMGSFRKPEVEVHVETLFETQGTASPDVFEDFGNKIMRIHVFDRTVNPYRAAGQLLKAHTSSGVDVYYNINDDYVRRVFADPFKQAAAQKVSGAVLTDAWTAISQYSHSPIVSTLTRDPVNTTDSSGTPVALTNEQIKRSVTKMVPSILYGTNASNVKSAALSSKQDALLTAAQLTGLNKNKQNNMAPNGAGSGGLPLRIIPASMSMSTFGCPLFNYGQFFFVDFNTGTTADNIYGITGLTHTFGPGSFDTQVTFSFYDAYGHYEGAPSIVDYLKATTKQFEAPKAQDLSAPTPQTPKGAAKPSAANEFGSALRKLFGG